MKKRYSDEQIVVFLHEAESGISLKDLCRRYGFSAASLYAWQNKFSGLEVTDVKRLKALEAENARKKGTEGLYFILSVPFFPLFFWD